MKYAAKVILRILWLILALIHMIATTTVLMAAIIFKIGNGFLVLLAMFVWPIIYFFN